MKKFLRLFAMTLLPALLGFGCATVTKGPSQKVEIDSEPPGATIFVNGELVGETPAEVRLRRARSHDVTLEKPGFLPHSEEIYPVWNEARTRTVRFGLDSLIGADRDLAPGRIVAQLETDPEQEEIVLSEMAERVIELDEQLYRGQINRREHERELARIMRKYGR